MHVLVLPGLGRGAAETPAGGFRDSGLPLTPPWVHSPGAAAPLSVTAWSFRDTLGVVRGMPESLFDTAPWGAHPSAANWTFWMTSLPQTEFVKSDTQPGEGRGGVVGDLARSHHPFRTVVVGLKLST